MANVNGSRVVFIVLLILILNINLRANQPAVSTKHSEAVVAAHRYSLSVLNNSTWGDFDPAPANGEGSKWLNLTGFQDSDNYAWTALPAVKQKALDQLKYYNGEEGFRILNGSSDSSILQYRNSTAWLRGRWLRDMSLSNTVLPKFNLSATAPGVKFTDRYERNITGKEGKLQLKLEEDKDDFSLVSNRTAQGITGVITIQDESSVGDGWEVRMNGVHLKNSATIIMATASVKFDGLFGLPHFALTESSFTTIKESMNKTITNLIDDEEAKIVLMRIDDTDSGPTTVVPSCDLIAYAHFRPLQIDQETSTEDNEKLTSLIYMLEEELRNPSGAPFSNTPGIEASMTIFSPDCGFVLVSKGPPDYAMHPGHIHGLRPEVLLANGKVLVLAFTVILTLQVALMVKQMRDSRTPTAKSRISFYTIALFSLGKGLTWVTFMVAASVDNSLYLLFTVVAFFAFLAGSFFGMKFMLDIWALQEPERDQHNRQRMSGDTIQAQTGTTGGSVATPATTTQTPVASTDTADAAPPIDTGASPIPIPVAGVPPVPPPAATLGALPQRSNFGSFYTKFYLLLLVTMFVSIHASAAWPPTLRNIYANLLAMTYLCIWFPQIYRNIVRNCRKALSWTFIIGQSVLNLLPVAYFWGYEENVLYVDTDVPMLLVLIGLVWVQWVILAAQEVLGPRFFVSESWSWVPHAWDYHPVLKEDEESGSLPLGLSATTIQEDQGPSNITNGKLADRGHKIYDCAICMQDIEVPVVKQEESTTGDIIAASLNSNFLARRNYMVTPCRHIFHTVCLEAWVGYRLQCPICREALPPL